MDLLYHMGIGIQHDPHHGISGHPSGYGDMNILFQHSGFFLQPFSDTVPIEAQFVEFLMDFRVNYNVNSASPGHPFSQPLV